MSYRNVVVGIDFSTESELALRRAVDVASRTAGRVSLVHVEPRAPWVISPDAVSGALHANYQSLLAEELTASQARLDEMAKRTRQQRKLEVTVKLAEGYADTELCAVASEGDADLICVGTHGRAGLRWLLLGSVAQRVVRLAEMDVLVARGPGKSDGGFPRILVASDFSDAAGRALTAALGLAADGGHIDLLHVVERLPAGVRSADADLITQAVADAMRRRGSELIADLGRDDIQVDFRVEVGSARASIAAQAERADYDLIALGSQGARGARRLLLGSVAEAVVQHAPCSVLVSHQRKPDAD